MDKQSLREAAHRTPRKMQGIATSFWPETDGHIAIGDMSVDELNIMSEVQKKNPVNYSATFICYALVDRKTGERIFGTTNERGEFSPTDRDWIKSQASVVSQLIPQIHSFFGLDVTARQAIDDAKKNLLEELDSLGILSPNELPTHLSRLLSK